MAKDRMLVRYKRYFCKWGILLRTLELVADVSFESAPLLKNDNFTDKFTISDLLKGFFQTYSDSRLFDRR